MGGRSSRDCIVDTSNPFGIVIGLLYFIRKLPMMLHHGLCIRTRLPGPVVVTLALVFASLCLQLDAISVRGNMAYFLH